MIKPFTLPIEAEWRICVRNVTVIGSDIGLALTNAWILLIRPLGTSLKF